MRGKFFVGFSSLSGIMGYFGILMGADGNLVIKLKVSKKFNLDYEPTPLSNFCISGELS